MEGGTEWGGGGRVEEGENGRATAQVRFRQVTELAGTKAPAPTERVAQVGPLVPANKRAPRLQPPTNRHWPALGVASQATGQAPLVHRPDAMRLPFPDTRADYLGRPPSDMVQRFSLYTRDI